MSRFRSTLAVYFLVSGGTVGGDAGDVNGEVNGAAVPAAPGAGVSGTAGAAAFGVTGAVVAGRPNVSSRTDFGADVRVDMI